MQVAKKLMVICWNGRRVRDPSASSARKATPRLRRKTFRPYCHGELTHVVDSGASIGAENR